MLVNFETQLCRIKGLSNHFVEVVTLLFCHLFFGICGKRNYGHLAFDWGFHPPNDRHRLVAVHYGHPNIHQHQGVVIFLNQRNGFFSVGGFVGLHLPPRLQILLQHQAVDRHVVYYQDAQRPA